jgi:hypothetical protein
MEGLGRVKPTPAPWNVAVCDAANLPGRLQPERGRAGLKACRNRPFAMERTRHGGPAVSGCAFAPAAEPPPAAGQRTTAARRRRPRCRPARRPARRSRATPRGAGIGRSGRAGPGPAGPGPVDPRAGSPRRRAGPAARPDSGDSDGAGGRPARAAGAASRPRGGPAAGTPARLRGSSPRWPAPRHAAPRWRARPGFPARRGRGCRGGGSRARRRGVREGPALPRPASRACVRPHALGRCSCSSRPKPSSISRAASAGDL